VSATTREERDRMMRAVTLRTPALAPIETLKRDREHFAKQPSGQLAEAWWGSRGGVQHVKHGGRLLTAGEAVRLLDHLIAGGSGGGWNW
jgi:hypothetical protein